MFCPHLNLNLNLRIQKISEGTWFLTFLGYENTILFNQNTKKFLGKGGYIRFLKKVSSFGCNPVVYIKTINNIFSNHFRSSLRMFVFEKPL